MLFKRSQIFEFIVSIKDILHIINKIENLFKERKKSLTYVMPFVSFICYYIHKLVFSINQYFRNCFMSR
jgi:hypothetical protein